MSDTPTRGERNNNPGNIDRNATHWQGMSRDQSSDARFIVFVSPVYGIRALAKTLLTYQRVHNLNTVHAIIDRWAPPNENDTGAYIKHVAETLGVAPDDRVSLDDHHTLAELTKAIIAHENGRCVYEQAAIDEGVALALA